MNVVLTCYFNSVGDSQRADMKWPADPTRLAPLLDSIVQHSPGCLPVVLTDCLQAEQLPTAKVHRAHLDAVSPYMARWPLQYLWLQAHPDAEWIWIVDATDVQMLNTPWPNMAPDRLYSCAEPTTIGADPWIRKHNLGCAAWCDQNGDKTMLNPGVVGGDRETMLWLLGEMTSALRVAQPQDPQEEFAWFNRIAYGHHRLTFGKPVTTPFRSFVRADPICWFAHK